MLCNSFLFVNIYWVRDVHICILLNRESLRDNHLWHNLLLINRHKFSDNLTNEKNSKPYKAMLRKYKDREVKPFLQLLSWIVLICRPKWLVLSKSTLHQTPLCQSSASCIRSSGDLLNSQKQKKILLLLSFAFLCHLQ